MVKKTAPTVTDATADFMPTLFRSRNAGCEFILNAFPSLYKRALGELKGRFTAGELSLVIDVFNATALTPELAGQTLEIQVADGIALDGLDSKWEVQKDKVLGKIRDLTAFHKTVLEIWGNGFWYRAAARDRDPELEEWLKALL